MGDFRDFGEDGADGTGHRAGEFDQGLDEPADPGGGDGDASGFGGTFADAGGEDADDQAACFDGGGPFDQADESDWARQSSNSGGGTVFRDPKNPGRQIRIMPGYAEGNRPDVLTHGPYASVGLFELLWLLNGAEFQLADAEKKAIAYKVAKVIVGSGRAKLYELAWPSGEIVNGPADLATRIDNPDAWPTEASEQYLALLP